MNKLLSNSSYSVGLIMAPRRHIGAGIRWSSYVGDLRYIATGSSSYNTFVNYNNCNNIKSSNKEQRDARQGSMNRGVRTFSTSSKPIKQYTKSAKLSTLSTAQREGAPHERLLILGSGVAGCSTALTAARYGIPVTVLHAGSNKEDCNSYWAQGGVIYRNYRLLEKSNNVKSSQEKEQKLVDTPLSLVNDIRIASGYTSPLQRSTSIEECTYSSHLHQNTNSNSTSSASNNNLMGKQCPKSGVQWNEDAAWKLACEGPSRIRELLLGTKDDGLGETHGCVVPFDRTTLPNSNENDDNDGLGKDVNCEEDDVLSLCLEASHAAPRIIHYADCTGKVITENITKAAAEHPLIEFVGDSIVTDLILDENSSDGNEEEGGGMVIGAQVLDKSTNQLNKYYAVHGVVLASGGLAGIYQHSTNPLGFNALGSSVGLALRMQERLTPSSSLFGGRTTSTKKNKSIVSDLEYVQFHPTSLYLPNEARFLLTEALRGEGAILRDLDGRAFAHDYHPNGELAPRDIVARAVFCESQKTVDAEDAAQHNAYLDITHRDSTWLKDRFPSIDQHLMSRDTPMDFTKERIPIIPAAHYTCGGVTTDLNGCVVGNRNLYAAGEAARTGLHGGNRLASTSLLEGLVYGASVGEMVAGVVKDESDNVALEEREKVVETMHHARHAIEQRLVMEEQQQQLSSSSSAATADERITQEATSILAHLKSLMWDNVGVVRTPTKLDLAVSELTAIRDQADRLWEDEGAGWEVVALRDAAHAGLAVADAALANRVSGGAHHVVLDEEDKDGSDDDDEEVVLARA